MGSPYTTIRIVPKDTYQELIEAFVPEMSSFDNLDDLLNIATRSPWLDRNASRDRWKLEYIDWQKRVTDEAGEINWSQLYHETPKKFFSRIVWDDIQERFDRIDLEPDIAQDIGDNSYIERFCLAHVKGPTDFAAWKVIERLFFECWIGGGPEKPAGQAPFDGCADYEGLAIAEEVETILKPASQEGGLLHRLANEFKHLEYDSFIPRDFELLRQAIIKRENQEFCLYATAFST